MVSPAYGETAKYLVGLGEAVYRFDSSSVLDDIVGEYRSLATANIPNGV